MGHDPQKLILVCPCGQKMKVPVEAMGKEASCVKCGQNVPINEATVKSTPNGSASPKPTFDVNDDIAIQQLLIENQITQDDVERALLVGTDIDEPIWAILIRLGCINSLDFHRLMVKQEGLASIDLAHYNIPSAVLDILSNSLARKHMAVPIDKLGKLLTLAMANPLDSRAVEAIETHTGLRVKTMLSTSEDIRRSIQKNYPNKFTSLSTNMDSKSMDFLQGFDLEHSNCPITYTLFSMKHIPIAQDTIDGVQQALHNTVNPLEEIISVVSNDPAAVLQLLRIANAEAYGFAGQVDNLGVALTLMGPEAVLAHLKDMTTKEKNEWGENGTYEDWISCGRIAGDACAAIAEACNLSSPASAKTLGLLSVIGPMIMADCLPNSFSTLMGGLDSKTRREQSQTIFDITPQAASVTLTSYWNLPKSIVEPISFSHAFSSAKQYKDHAAVLSLGILLAELFLTKQELHQKYDLGASAHLKLEWSDVGTIYNNLLQNTRVRQMA